MAKKTTNNLLTPADEICDKTVDKSSAPIHSSAPLAAYDPDDISIAALESRMPDLDDQRRWQMFIMSKNFELAKSLDPDVKAKALERLAKTSIAGLYEQRVQVNITNLPAEELQKKLDALVNRINERVIDHKA